MQHVRIEINNVPPTKPSIPSIKLMKLIIPIKIKLDINHIIKLIINKLFSKIVLN